LVHFIAIIFTIVHFRFGFFSLFSCVRFTVHVYKDDLNRINQMNSEIYRNVGKRQLSNMDDHLGGVPATISLPSTTQQHDERANKNCCSG
jgi:hypothetical protein